MKVVYHRALPAGPELAAIDAFLVRARGAHYMQAPAWRAVDVGVGAVTRTLVARDGDRIVGVARLTRRRRGVVPSPAAVIERGPVVDDVEHLAQVLPAMQQAARWHGIDHLRVQPYFAGAAAARATALAVAAGFTPSADLDGPHQATLRIDLPATPGADLFAGSERSDLRRHARKAREAGVVVRRGGAGDLAGLARLYHQMMDAQGGTDRSDAYFASFAPLLAQDAAAIFCAEHDGALEAAVLIGRHPGQVTFHLGATSSTRRPYKKMLLPLMAGATWGASLGATVFDLGGVPVESDADPKRRAIAQFKFDFARTVVPVTPVLYAPPSALGTLARALVRRARRR